MKYGILCAMDEEIKSLHDSLANETTKNIKGIDFFAGTINGESVVLVKSGIGKVEAGITSVLLVTEFDVDIIINTGSAAGIGKGLSVGDVVISTETAYHDADATAAGYEFGQVPDQPARFKADRSFVDKVMAAAESVGLEAKTGLIVSGDQFIASQKQIDTILDHFPDALSSEMEGAAVGQVANQFHIPYVVIRAMSDVGDENADMSFNEFVVEAGKRSAKMMLNFLQNQD
ncbi:5'-methylthioadenosine/adenosylhomocysteine nucleosidase [Lactobacillus sp. Sy-1]|uniref:5'-methylthioadenosine/adenosylhomocysteine nucleosidase n=1 Tax=Lactobacillus sp. Sy-1 TaxID=2109645 RepID=UPI001C57F75A|nr:5'-methylthioadenosine/adenosylhomocysteine nucleosidase [Lactobacillus sp. Sy-1]MBW1605424.1 5'-methylthioadenosine/adenosylhomocysteine nucleosidase [Lactobacillus sp. Sy-1]